MRNNLLVCFLLAVVSCSNPKGSHACKENIEFRDSFQWHIKNVEAYTNEQLYGKKITVTSDGFLKSIGFITKYVPASMSKIYNYQVGYPSIKDLQIDKTNWMNWYDSLKCQNIHFK